LIAPVAAIEATVTLPSLPPATVRTSPTTYPEPPELPNDGEVIALPEPV
jgi:hypothetical protein